MAFAICSTRASIELHLLAYVFFAVAAVCAPRAENPTIPVKRRRVTAEMEGKYIVHMPKGTTPRTKKILEQQQAAKGTVAILWGWGVAASKEGGCGKLEMKVGVRI